MTATILEAFAVEEKRIRDEAAELDRASKRALAAKEKERATAHEERARIEAELARMKADYFKVEEIAQAEERARIEASGMTAADLLAGQLDPADYARAGVGAADIARKVEEASRARLDGLLDGIRAKALDAYHAEEKELRLELDCIALAASPARTFGERMKEQMRALDERLTAATAGGAAAGARYAEVERIGGGRFEGDIIFNLDLAGLKAMLFDPRIPAHALDRLRELIAEASAKPSAKWRLAIKHVFGSSPERPATLNLFEE